MKQKLIAFFAACMLLSGLESFGQTTYLDVVLNGVSTNFNYGNSNSALKNYKKSVFGAQAGVSFQAGITPHFSIVPELYFMMKGGKLLAGNSVTGNETTVRLYTAEIPVLARFHLGRAYLNAGPSIAYDFGGNNKLAGSSKAISFQNGSEGFKRFDASVQIGGGYELPFKNKRIALDVRYCYGVTNISYDREIYNRSLIVSIHFSSAWKTNPLAKNKL